MEPATKTNKDSLLEYMAYLLVESKYGDDSGLSKYYLPKGDWMDTNRALRATGQACWLDRV
jgi:hypothetical protein